MTAPNTDRATRLETAMLQVLADTRRLITRCELGRLERVKGIHRDPAAIRAGINALVTRGLVSEPNGKGQGIEITETGRRRLAA